MCAQQIKHLKQVMDLYFALREPKQVAILKCKAHQKTDNFVARGNFEADRAVKLYAGYERNVQLVQVQVSGRKTAGEDRVRKHIDVQTLTELQNSATTL